MAPVQFLRVPAQFDQGGTEIAGPLYTFGLAVWSGSEWVRATKDLSQVTATSCRTGSGGTVYASFDPQSVNPSAGKIYHPEFELMAGGAGKFAYIVDNYQITSAPSGIQCWYTYQWTGTDLMINDGLKQTLVKHFNPTNRDSTFQQNLPTCFDPGSEPCFGGFEYFSNNFLLYSTVTVPQPGGSYQYKSWVYDLATGQDIDLGSIESYHSDGNSVVLTRQDSHGINNLFLYNRTIYRTSGILPLTHYNRQTYASWLYRAFVDGRYVSWVNQTDFVNFYDLGTQAYLPSIKGSDPNSFIAQTNTGDGLFDFNNGTAVWITDYSSTPVARFLYVYTIATSNLMKIELPPFKTSTYLFNWHGITRVFTSRGWIFLNALPADWNFFQIFAFQAVTGYVGIDRGTISYPLQEVKVDVFKRVNDPNPMLTTYTDSNGFFSIPVYGKLSDMNPLPFFRVTLIQKDNKFRILDYSGDANVKLKALGGPAAIGPPTTDGVVVFGTNSVSIIDPNNDYLVRLDAATLSSLSSTWTTASSQGHLPDFAYIYHNIHLAYELARDILHADSYIDRTIDVWAFSRYKATQFASVRGVPVININRTDSRISSPDAPDNREWHEFGHAVMWFSPIGGLHNLPPVSRLDFNHAGYRNADSADSWIEGFAMFYSMLVGHYIDMRREAYRYGQSGGEINFSWDYPIYAGLGKQEDSAAASILWDMFDSWKGVYDWSTRTGTLPDSDGVSIPISTLWQTVVNNNVQNLYDLWFAFRAVPGVNGTFIHHGIYEDLNGNGRYDNNDVVGTSRWAIAEFDALNFANFNNAFVFRVPHSNLPGGTAVTADLAAVAAASKILINHAGQVRHDIPPLPGSGILLNLHDKETNSSVPDVTVNVRILLPDGTASYSYDIRLSHGYDRFFLSLPEFLNATAVVTIYSQGYSPTSAFSITTDTYVTSLVNNYFVTNGTGKDLMTINASMVRIPGTFKQYSLVAVGPVFDSRITAATNSTVGAFSYDHNQSSIFLSAYTEAGKKGLMDVSVPLALNNGTFVVHINESSAIFSIKKVGASQVLEFTLPSGRNDVGIKLVPSYTVSTQTTIASTTGSSTSGASTTTGTSTTNTCNSPICALSGNLLYVLVAVATGAILAVGYYAARRRKANLGKQGGR